MENLKGTLTKLAELQNMDIKIFDVKQEIENFPKKIDAKKQELANAKQEYENKKSKYVKLSSDKKEKEAKLTEQENVIRKHTESLNTIKSNDLYKNCLLEIEKAKADKSVIEDEILVLMDEIDKELVVLKQDETKLKETESAINAQIKELENNQNSIKASVADLEKSREEFAKNIPANVLSQYERIRETRNGQGLALVNGDSCGGCNMVLRPQLIVQATKCAEIVYCDNCSRILFNKID